MMNYNAPEGPTNKQINSDEKMSMADRFIKAMFLPGDYPQLMKLSFAKVVTFLCLLIFLVSFVQYAIPVLARLAGYGGVKDYVIDVLPDFSLKDGEFFLSEKYERNDEAVNSYYLIDTSKESFTADDVDRDKMQVVLVSRTNILVYNNVTGLGGSIEEEKFSDFSRLIIDNESVASLAPFIYLGLFGMYILMYIMCFVRYLLSALFYAFLMYILTRVMMSKLSFGIIYKIALFAQTIGALVSAVAVLVGTPLFIMAGSTFAMVVTVIIMNRAFFKIVPPPTVRR
ncbi:MAG: DUF1189 domain-containing protein [Lachnospiraceae bacterium]|nr:DUF1189 domain-containing protein [Lachnospiraceae bacterium]